MEEDATMFEVDGREKAHVSTTWLPCVFMILILWPARTMVAAPRRAGIVCRAMVLDV